MTIAWLFEDERTEAAHRAMIRIAAEGALVPGHWRLEVANVLRNAVRRGRCDEAYVDRSLGRLEKLPIRTDGETDAVAWHATRALSRELSLTAYDAAYLELALRLAVPLATCDRELIAAAQRRGVDVVTA